MYDSTYMRDAEQANSERWKAELRLPGAGGGGTWELLSNGDRISVRDDEKVLETVVIVTIL